MRHPWANILLFTLLFGQLITGFFGLINGLAENRWLLYVHGIGAYAISLTLLWKGVIIFDVYGRGKRLGWRRLAFLGLLLLLVATLLTGLLWTLDGPIYLIGFSLVTLHMFLAIPLLLIMVWHAWHFRWIIGVRQALGRRAFVRSAGLTVTGMLLWRSASGAKAAANLAGAGRRFTGSYETGSFSGRFPTVSWISDRPPPVDLRRWRLAVEGAVGQPLVLTYDSLGLMATDSLDAILDCTGGWYSAQNWQGVNLGRLLNLASPGDEARSFVIESATGYRRRFPIHQAQHYLLALHVTGEPLSPGHGFPVRLVAPGQRGVNWVKWVNRVQVSTRPSWWQSPLPLQ